MELRQPKSLKVAKSSLSNFNVTELADLQNSIKIRESARNLFKEKRTSHEHFVNRNKELAYVTKIK